MKLKYLINNDPNHYVQFQLDIANKLLSGKYVRNNTTEVENTVSVEDVLAIEPSFNPFIQVAKKGLIWDFHLIKRNAQGQEFRKSLGLMTTTDLTPTKLEAYNDSTNDITFVDYLTHDLDVYNSSLSIATYDFTTLKGITGQSSISDTTPLITADHQLKLGYQANISLELLGEAAVNVNKIPFQLSLRIDSLGNNDASGQDPFEIQLGDNRLRFSTIDGVVLESTTGSSSEVILDTTALASLTYPLPMRLVVKPSGVSITIGDQSYTLSTYDKTSSIDKIRLFSFCNGGEYTLLGPVRMHGLENYREDSEAPEQVTGVRAYMENGQIRLAWFPNTENDLEGYKIYVNGRLQSLGIVQTNEYILTGLQEGTMARISITAVDRSGNESPSSDIVELVPRSISSKEVSNVLVYFSNKQVELDFTPPTYDNFTKIKIYRDDLSNHTVTEVAVLPSTTTKHLDAPAPGRYVYVITTVATVNGIDKETSGTSVFVSVP